MWGLVGLCEPLWGLVGPYEPLYMGYTILYVTIQIGTIFLSNCYSDVHVGSYISVIVRV